MDMTYNTHGRVEKYIWELDWKIEKQKTSLKV